MISNEIRNNLTKSSWIRKMFEEGARLKKIYGAENVFDFSIGNPDLPPPKQVEQAIIKYASEPNVHKYMPNPGFPDVRAKVAEFTSKNCSLDIPLENIFMSVGAAGGLNVIFRAILNPNDEVLVLSPYFVEYLTYVKNHGGIPVIVETAKKTFQLNINNIKKALTKKTKAIILNSPNNPTGVIYPREQLDKLAELLTTYSKDNNTEIVIISDEPYKQLNYKVEVPNLLDVYDNVMLVNSFSKSVSLPGGRIGYIAVSPNICDKEFLLAALAYTTRTLGFVNAPAIYQKAVAEVIDLPTNKEYYEEKRDALFEIIIKTGFECIKPDGAFYLFAKSPIADDVEFARIAAQYNILIVPGSGFGCPGYFRLCYCIDLKTILNSESAFVKLANEFK